MPKLKTNKSTKKRIRISKKGKGRHFKAGRGHLLMNKKSKRKRSLGKPSIVTKADESRVKRMLPYA